MNAKLMSLGLSITAALMLTACTATDDSGDSSGDGASNDPSKVKPVAAYTCEKTPTVNGKTITTKSGADGDLKIECNDSGGRLVFNNVNEIVIAELVSTETIDFEKDDGETINVTVTTNLKAGTRSYVGTTSAHGSLDCVETYDTGTLPVTINDVDDLDIYIYFENMQQTDTTCPDWVNGEEDDDDDSDPKSSELQENTTITDVNGKISNVATYKKI